MKRGVRIMRTPRLYLADLILRPRIIERAALSAYQMLDTLRRKREQTVHFFARERRAFGSSLHFDETIIARANNVHINSGARIFVVFEIEQRRVRNDADADGGDFVGERKAGDFACAKQAAAGEGERDVSARDRGRARAAVCLQHIAVNCDGALAQEFHVNDGAKGASDETLDFVCAPGGAAASCFALRALMCSARQHRVFGGDPALPAPAQKRRHAFFN